MLYLQMSHKGTFGLQVHGGSRHVCVVHVAHYTSINGLWHTELNLVYISQSNSKVLTEGCVGVGVHGHVKSRSLSGVHVAHYASTHVQWHINQQISV